MAEKTVFSSHPFGPLFGPGSEILILGSFPSPASREEGFYYGHPRNRFWDVLAGVYHEEAPSSIEEKKAFILSHNLALYDAYEALTVQGSSDASIRDAMVADITPILKGARIKKVLANGKAAGRGALSMSLSIPVYVLPSTSPANAAWSLSKLISAWGKALLL
jgi:hypoxanthine-DNA glycosylase